MTSTDNKEVLAEVLQRILSNKIVNIQTSLDEVTITILANHVREVSEILHNDLLLQFDTLIDLCGIDYLTYGENLSELNQLQNKRFAVIYHLLSVALNQRLRLRVIAEDDELPVVESVTDIWPVANWFEREAYDMFGVRFNGHPNLRKILTHPESDAQMLKNFFTNNIFSVNAQVSFSFFIIFAGVWGLSFEIFEIQKKKVFLHYDKIRLASRLFVGRARFGLARTTTHLSSSSNRVQRTIG